MTGVFASAPPPDCPWCPMTIRLDCLSPWRCLSEHARKTADRRIETLFRDDPDRLQTHSAEAAGLFLDYSRHNVDAETRELLLDLARVSDVAGWRARQFRGEKINATEGVAVLHTALRATERNIPALAPAAVQRAVEEVLDRMEVLVSAVRSGQWRGHTHKPIRTVVNIGIGGSHLGPAMVCQALSDQNPQGPEVRFVSHLDADDFHEAVRDADPETTLFILASKSFTTSETLLNAELAGQWLGLSPGRGPGAEKHWVAVTGHRDRAVDFGFVPDNILPLPTWVGGRFSLWSAMGISIALKIGMDGFRALLKGGHAMDQHFLNAPFEHNLPVLLAMTGIWCRNFRGASSQAVIPYAQSLALLPAFLQQMEMESNGKRVTWYGEEVSWDTCPVIWGAVGTHAQHTFFQQLHMGSEVIPVDFIVVKRAPDAPEAMHQQLLANAAAQSTALMTGRPAHRMRHEDATPHPDAEMWRRQAPHRVYPGNRPSNMIILDALTPQTLGALIALYEHKVFVQGVVWQVCSFDQWGVELGKELATDIGQVLTGGDSTTALDPATRGLLARLGFPVGHPDFGS